MHTHQNQHADKYGDLPLGLYLVRGDAMVMLGEVDPAKEAGSLTKVSADVSYYWRRRVLGSVGACLLGRLDGRFGWWDKQAGSQAGG